jgi:hypothetical protein
VLDVDFGGQKVWPVARGLAAQGVPFLFISGEADLALELPSDLIHSKILRKPFDQSTLGAGIAEILEQHDRNHQRDWSACLGPMAWMSISLII